MNIIIFGATGGLGQALARRLAGEQHTLILHGKNEPRLTKLYDELVEKTEVYALPLDFMNFGPPDAEHYATLLKETVGTLDAIIFCSGYNGQRAPVVHMAPHEWVKMQQINLNTPFLITKSFWPLLSPEAKVIFTLAPEAFDKSAAHNSAYAASKLGLLGLVRALQAENMNTGITVSGYDPIEAATALHHNAYPGLPHVADPTVAIEGYLALLESPSMVLRRDIAVEVD